MIHMSKAGIYYIRNIQNNKRYIGQTIDFDRRKHEHFKNLRNNTHVNDYLQHSFNKYGEQNFEFKRLLTCETKGLNTWEQFFIDAFHTKDKRFGYNICDAGVCPDNTNENHGMWRQDIENNELLDDYLSGLNGSELAEKYKCSRRTINRRLIKILGKEKYHEISYKRVSTKLTGVERCKQENCPHYRMDIPNGETLFEEYKAGATQVELAEKYNCKQATIWERIRPYNTEHFHHTAIKSRKSWDATKVAYRRGDMFRRGKVADYPKSCFVLRYKNKSFMNISFIEPVSPEIISSLIEEFI